MKEHFDYKIFASIKLSCRLHQQNLKSAQYLLLMKWSESCTTWGITGNYFLAEAADDLLETFPREELIEKYSKYIFNYILSFPDFPRSQEQS